MLFDETASYIFYKYATPIHRAKNSVFKQIQRFFDHFCTHYLFFN